MTSCSKELRPAATQKHPLQITTRTPEGPDFKFELLPLHSPLLGQSLLVSFPPLIDMLKFSGYPYLIRGQPLGVGTDASVRPWALRPGSRSLDVHFCYARRVHETLPTVLGRAPRRAAERNAGRGRWPIAKLRLMVVMTLEQACPPEYRGAQCAFKDSMIHSTS